MAEHTHERPQQSHTRSFAAWLRHQRERDDPVGDLAHDFISDWNARGIRTPAQLSLHLIRSGACYEARLALRDAAREYRLLERDSTGSLRGRVA
jgi:hypothetical protein